MEKYKGLSKAIEALYDAALKEFSQMPLQGHFGIPSFRRVSYTWKCETDVMLRMIAQVNYGDHNLRNLIAQVRIPQYELQMDCGIGFGTTEETLERLQNAEWRDKVKGKYEELVDEMLTNHSENQAWVHSKLSAFEPAPLMPYADFKTYLQTYGRPSSAVELGCGWLWNKSRMDGEQWVYNNKRQKYVQLVGAEKDVMFIKETSFPDSTINMLREECPLVFPYASYCSSLKLGTFKDGRLRFDWILRESMDGLSFRDPDGFGIDDIIEIKLYGYFNEDFELIEVQGRGFDYSYYVPWCRD